MRIIRINFFFFLPRDSFAFCSLEPLCERSRSSARLAADTKDVFSDGYEKLGYFGGQEADGRKETGNAGLDFAARVIERCCRCRSKKVVVVFAVVVVVVVWLSAAGLIGRRDGIPRGKTVHLCSADSRLARASVARFLI